MPGGTSIAFLDNPTTPGTKIDRVSAEVAAKALGVRLLFLHASSASEIEAAFATLAQQRADALLVNSNAFFFVQFQQLAALAARYAVPAIYHSREAVAAGGLMSYGASIPDGYRLSGIYTGRILKGDKPADLPVEQSTRIEFLVNLKTARALGREVPTSILLRADEVIE